MLVLVLLSVGLIPLDAVTHSDVDLVEVNHFYDDSGKLVFDQIIFYDWDRLSNRYHVRAWRLIKDSSIIPKRIQGTNYYQSIWYDGEVLRRLRTKALRETHTQYDPELLEREKCPKECRTGLMKPRKSAPQ